MTQVSHVVTEHGGGALLRGVETVTLELEELTSRVQFVRLQLFEPFLVIQTNVVVFKTRKMTSVVRNEASEGVAHDVEASGESWKPKQSSHNILELFDELLENIFLSSISMFMTYLPAL